MTRCPSCATENPDTSRFCGSCAAPLGSTGGSSQTDTIAEPSRPRSATARPGSRLQSSALPPGSSSSADEGRFPPGTLLLERYRIIALLGVGGMGEVYRATDLKLGQPVALKFLPEAVAEDERALARFRNEVRIARQVSHPNVCRVYDIGEIDGLQFLSMEYVDGEDLGSLLRRIGRLPADKALEIARKLCAGLAAAHDKGVLHRDLKPSNVMLDGRGNVLITDFGLAALSGQVQKHEIRHGTPAYMAPEQLAGKEVTPASDIYALGLVLYEVFTGKRAFEADTLDGLLKLEEGSAPPSLTTLVREIDPAVERVILRCLAPEPRQRPSSPLAVAAALPGGDPLAAALAAGETPSPDMVAASGASEGLRPAVAMMLLGGIVVALIAAALLTWQTSVLAKIPFENSAEALNARAREIAQRLGYTQHAVGTASDFENSYDYTQYVQKHDPSPSRWAHIGTGQPDMVHFWYRQSPRYFDPGYELRVSPDHPHINVSGEVLLQLDPEGRLLYLSAMPPQVDPSTGPPPPTDWSALFAAAGLDLGKFRPADPQWLPEEGFDSRAAWTGAYPNAPKVPLRVEAASWRGKPVYFHMIGAWTRPWRMREFETTAGERARNIIALTLFCVILVVSALMARRNTKLSRSDARGAMRLAGFIFAVNMLHLLFSMDHVPSEDELGLIIDAISQALFSAALIWVLYLALEPIVRRRWPQTIVSWSRILSGKLRDPLAGGDILIGVAFGLFWVLLFLVEGLIGQRFGWLPHSDGLGMLGGIRYVAGGLLSHMAGGIMFAFVTFLLMFLLRLVLRKDWLAAVGFVSIFVLLKALGSSEGLWINLPVYALVYAVFVVLLLRYGIVPLVISIFTADFLLTAPITLDFSVWYIASSLLALLAVLAVAFYGFHCTVAGKRLFDLE
jgi:serine/threonine-protein kinase